MRYLTCSVLVLTFMWLGSEASAQDAVSELNDRRNKTAECLEALEEGTNNVSSELLDEVSGFTRIFSEDLKSDILSCLEGATGLDWVYHNPTGQFLEFSQIKELGKIRQHEIKVQKLVDAIFRAKADQKNSLVNRYEGQRRREVIAETHSACNALYAEDQISALVNAVCHEIFFSAGTPATTSFEKFMDDNSDKLTLSITPELSKEIRGVSDDVIGSLCDRVSERDCGVIRGFHEK